MARIDAAVRDVVVRGARRQVRLMAGPVRRELSRLKHAVGRLRQDVNGLRDVAALWRRSLEAVPWQAAVPEDEAAVARLSPRLIRKLRARLGISQSALSRLVGVSAGAVVQWEQGRSAPSEQRRRALIGLRKLGRRDVKRALAALPESHRDGKRAVGRRPARRRTRRTGRTHKRRHTSRISKTSRS